MGQLNRDVLPPHLPPLPTFELEPSWTNRAGRVDRSASLALSVSRLWRRIEPDAWKRLCSPDPAREAWTEIAVHAIDLVTLHRRRSPHILRGDLRTTKSNVMRKLPRQRGAGDGRSEAAPMLPSPRGRGAAGEGVPAMTPAITPGMLNGTISARHAQQNRRSRKQIHKKTAAPNPNHGASSIKALGLTRDDSPFDDVYDWRQVIRMERWRYPLAQPSREQVNRLCWRTFRGPRCQHFLVYPACTDKYRKLFTIVATRDELRDARLAESWLAMMAARLRAARRTGHPLFMAVHAALVDRYGPLMSGRRLVCRKCLGIRYGEVKPRCLDARTAELYQPLRYKAPKRDAARDDPRHDLRVAEFWERVQCLLAVHEAQDR